jgi:Protein of unknown function DUF262/Protein of unknown function (DUF1524)
MPAQLTANEKKISQIFSDDYEFSIPSYQRPYSWTTEQAGELLDDLTSFMQGFQCEVAEMAPYFLGSIVLIKNDGAPASDVVDGQQRLTTLTVLLSALRATLPSERASEITNFIYQAGSMITGTADRYRLLLRERDRDFFQSFVQRENGIEPLIASVEELPDSQRNLRLNAELFFNRLKSMDEKERTRLAQFIATRCFLVAVSTPDLDSAYRIFSVMNSRGLDLAATDILKASIIGAISAALRDKFTQKWEAVEEQLGRESFLDLFGHIRMVYRKAKPHGTLLKEFNEHVSASFEPATLIADIIEPYANAYGAIISSTYESASNATLVNGHLRWLNRLEFSDWVPPALEFFKINRGNSQLMADFFKGLERLAFSMLICKTGVNARIERFSRLTKNIQEKLDINGGNTALELTTEEKAAFTQVLDGPIYDTLPARTRTTLLLRLDDVLSGGGATYDYPIVTVEHILPQNPASDSQWTQWFPRRAEREANVHRLGNLALLTRRKNSAASNFEFERKKSAYFAIGGVSPFPLTTTVLQVDEWTPEALEKRQRRLLKSLVTHWRL